MRVRAERSVTPRDAGVGWGERSEPQRGEAREGAGVGVRLRLTPTYAGKIWPCAPPGPSPCPLPGGERDESVR